MEVLCCAICIGYQSIATACHPACVDSERSAGTPMIHIPSAAAVRGAKAQFRQHAMMLSPGSHFDWHDLDSWIATKFPAFDERGQHWRYYYVTVPWMTICENLEGRRSSVSAVATGLITTLRDAMAADAVTSGH